MSLQSENINEIMTALAKAQGKMDAAVKDNTNPHFKSKYADLASVWEACRKALSDNGLAITQTLDFVSDKQVLVTTLGHTSGQWIKSVMALPIQKPGPQEVGSCLSYCRRYALAAMVGVYQDDDDANKAQAPYSKTKEEKVKSSSEVVKVANAISTTELTEEQRKTILDLKNQVNQEDFIKNMLMHLNISDLEKVPVAEYGSVVTWMTKKIKQTQEAANEPAKTA